MPHGRKPAMKRCRESHATAADARDSRDSRYGKPMATPVPPRNFRLLNLDFIASGLRRIGVRAGVAFAGASLWVIRAIAAECFAGCDHGQPRLPVAASGSHGALR